MCASSAEWPQGEADTNAYRTEGAVEWFNLMNPVACDVLALKPTMESWVFHIACFIVPRQMVALGDPARRSCDACESFGAMAKKLVKHSQRAVAVSPINQLHLARTPTRSKPEAVEDDLYGRLYSTGVHPLVCA